MVNLIYEENELWAALKKQVEASQAKKFSLGWTKLDDYLKIAKGQLTIITGVPSSGKALAVDTPIPTPSGWKIMGDLKKGDKVFGLDGKVCTIVRATEVMKNRKCYEVSFTDGDKIICDAEHLWLTRDDKARRSERESKIKRGDREETKPRGKDQRHLKTYPSGKTTQEIAESLYAQSDGRLNHFVPITKALQYPKKVLPIKPYTLGAWLGDGTSLNAQMTSADQEVLDSIIEDGYGVKKWNRAYSYGIADIRNGLKEIGVFGNKHIPKLYLNSSIKQRKELLKGLMDTDGSCAKNGGCEYYSTNKKLAHGVLELVKSLGIRAKIRKKIARLYGKNCGISHTVSFTTKNKVFKIKRKLKRQKGGIYRSSWQAITECSPVKSVPVKCIQVDSDDSLYLAGHGLIPTHNSNWMDAVMVNLAQKYNWRFFVFAPESHPLGDHMENIGAKYASMPLSGTWQGIPNISEKEYVGIAHWIREHFDIINTMKIDRDIANITNTFKAVRQYKSIDAILLDPWNELEHKRPSYVSETEYLGVMLGKIRSFALEYDIHVFIVAHPTKVFNDKRSDTTTPFVKPYDISGSANWYNKADNIISVFREFGENDFTTKIHILKVRRGRLGKVGSVDFEYIPSTGEYR